MNRIEQDQALQQKCEDFERLCHTLYDACQCAYDAMEFVKKSGDKNDWKGQWPWHRPYRKVKLALQKATQEWPVDDP